MTTLTLKKQVTLELELQQVARFIQSKQVTTWLTSPTISVYVRKSQRVSSDGRQVTCFDIANITVNTARNTGVFTRYYNLVRELVQTYSGFDCIYIESVQNPYLLAHLKRRGLEFRVELQSFLDHLTN